MAKNKTLLIVGIIAVAGIAAYFMFKKREPEPPPGEVGADIENLIVSVS